MSGPFPDTSTCKRCGMPLAYDRFVAGVPADAPRTSLCTFCSMPEGLRNAVPYRCAPWALDLVFDVYRRRLSPWRGIASAARHIRVLPTRARAFAELVHLVPRPKPDRKYDIVVLYSGGKDSSYMLLDLSRRGFRVCAWMLNQGYQSPIAIENARRLCTTLGVDLHIDVPENARMNSLFRLGFDIDLRETPELVRAVMTYGSACWPCFSTIAARATKFCSENDAAFCFIGTQAGQNRLDYGGQGSLDSVVPRPEYLLDKFIGPIAALASERAPGSADLLQRSECPNTILLPYYEFVPKPPVEQQIAKLQKAGWKMPNNTGACSTNCMINELGRQVMRRKFGFDLYQIIDANERRLRPGAGPAPVAPLDAHAVRRGAEMLKLTPEEKAGYGIHA